MRNNVWEREFQKYLDYETGKTYIITSVESVYRPAVGMGKQIAPHRVLTHVYDAVELTPQIQKMIDEGRDVESIYKRGKKRQIVNHYQNVIGYDKPFTLPAYAGDFREIGHID